MNWREILRIWGLTKYGSLNKFADALEVKASHLSRMLNAEEGEFEPKFPFIKRLWALGFDLNLLFGESMGATEFKIRESKVPYNTGDIIDTLNSVNEKFRELFEVSSQINNKMGEAEKLLLTRQFYFMRAIVTNLTNLIINTKRTETENTTESINTILNNTNQMLGKLDEFFLKLK